MSELDAEELYFLAIDALQRSERDKALAFIKESVAIEATSQNVYLLGTMYADLKMFDRAIEAYAAVLDADPEHLIARLQLGLIRLLIGERDQACEDWKELTTLPEDHFLTYFGRGLTAFAQDDLKSARDLLTEGFRLNDEVPTLNSDLGRIVTGIDEALGAQSETAESKAEVKEEGSATGEYFLSAYQSNKRVK